MDNKTLRRADLITSIILMIIAILGFIMSLSLVIKTLEKGRLWYESAGLFPLIVTSLLALCSFLIFLRARKDGARFDFLTLSKLKELKDSREARVAAIVIGLLAIYIFILLKVLQYSIATFIFLFAFIYIFNEKNRRSLFTSFLVSIITTVVLTYGFGNLAMIPLP